jgi:hypothetical protein
VRSTSAIADLQYGVRQRRLNPGFAARAILTLVRGRFHDASDRDGGALPVVIDETFASRSWPNQDPVGKRMVFGSPASATRG